MLTQVLQESGQHFSQAPYQSNFQMHYYNVLLYFPCSPGVRLLQKVKKEITMAAELLLYNYCILYKPEDICPAFLDQILAFCQVSKIMRAKSLGSFGITILFQESELLLHYINEASSSTALLFGSERNI